MIHNDQKLAATRERLANRMTTNFRPRAVILMLAALVVAEPATLADAPPIEVPRGEAREFELHGAPRGFLRVHPQNPYVFAYEDSAPLPVERAAPLNLKTPDDKE